MFMYVYIYVYIHVYLHIICVYIYIYIYTYHLNGGSSPQKLMSTYANITSLDHIKSPRVLRASTINRFDTEPGRFVWDIN